MYSYQYLLIKPHLSSMQKNRLCVDRRNLQHIYTIDVAYLSHISNPEITWQNCVCCWLVVRLRFISSSFQFLVLTILQCPQNRYSIAAGVQKCVCFYVFSLNFGLTPTGTVSSVCFPASTWTVDNTTDRGFSQCTYICSLFCQEQSKEWMDEISYNQHVILCLQLVFTCPDFKHAKHNFFYYFFFL